MDEDDHRRAEEEMNALSLRHLQQLRDRKKLGNRVAALLYKLLLGGVVLAFLSLLPPQLPSVVRNIRHALFSRTWDVVNVLLVAFAVTYGVLGRGARQNNETDESPAADLSYDEKFFDFDSVNRRMEDYSNVGERRDEVVESSSLGDDEERDYSVVWESPVRRLRGSVSSQDFRELGSEEDSNPRRAVDDMDYWTTRRSRRRSGYSAPKANGVEDSAPKSNEVQESRPLSEDSATMPKGPEDAATAPSVDKMEVNPSDYHISEQVTDNVATDFPPKAPAPPHPPPPPPPPPPRDSKPDAYESLRRKKKEPAPPPSPPPPPPPPPPPLETMLPQHRSRNASDPRREKSRKSDKVKTPPNPIPAPPIPPPLPAASEIGKQESKHRRSKSKEESKHRRSKSAKELANAFGLLPQSDRKSKKIPSPPAPPPLPSTLQQWWSSYKRESRSKNKDSEPSPRHRSDKSSRKVHSSTSPPPPPPPPPPAPIYTTDSKYHRKKKASEKIDIPEPPIYSVDSQYLRNVNTEKTVTPKPPIYPSAPKCQRNRSSMKKDSPKPIIDETSGKRDSSIYKEQNVGGDLLVGESLSEKRSSSIPLPPPSSIPLPPPPPPPPFPMSELHWSPFDEQRPRNRTSSSPAPEPDSEPEPEKGWAFVFRKQFSLDNVDSPFCPSPSPDEVNRKADAFIANFHQQMRLQKMNSVRERQQV